MGNEFYQRRDDAWPAEIALYNYYKSLPHIDGAYAIPGTAQGGGMGDLLAWDAAAQAVVASEGKTDYKAQDTHNAVMELVECDPKPGFEQWVLDTHYVCPKPGWFSPDTGSKAAILGYYIFDEGLLYLATFDRIRTLDPHRFRSFESEHDKYYTRGFKVPREEFEKLIFLALHVELTDHDLEVAHRIGMCRDFDRGRDLLARQRASLVRRRAT